MRRMLSVGVAALALACGPASAGAAVSTAPAVVDTGNVLVLLKPARASAAAVRAVDATAARLGARSAGVSVPEIGLVTLRAPVGMALEAFAGELRALPGVASAQVEHRLVPRFVPNDPALTASAVGTGVEEWELAREGFYSAWNVTHGDGALVGVVDTGADASHPDLANKIVGAVDQQGASDATGTARTDEVGHGTHVSSLACAGTNDGVGMAGAGFNCKLLIEKSDFSDSSIAASIVDAANRHVGAINMSFGPTTCTDAPAPDAELRALNYAASKKVVLVAAAADQACTQQGDPANMLQPAGTGPDINKGMGLSVTAADYAGGRANFAGYGSEISLAAFGSNNADASPPGFCSPEPGVLGAFPPIPTGLDNPIEGGPVCRATIGSGNYAYLQGTSMAAPQVAAAAAMIRALNPFATLTDVLRTLKQTAQRPSGSGFGNDLGWGILNAGAAVDAIRRVDRLPPVSRLRAPRVSHTRAIRLRWSGHDQRWPQLIASGLARFAVYLKLGPHRSRLLTKTKKHTFVFTGQPGQSYTFYVVAIDKAGNRQQKPPLARTQVAPNAH